MRLLFSKGVNRLSFGRVPQNFCTKSPFGMGRHSYYSSPQAEMIPSAFLHIQVINFQGYHWLLLPLGQSCSLSGLAGCFNIKEVLQEEYDLDAAKKPQDLKRSRCSGDFFQLCCMNRFVMSQVNGNFFTVQCPSRDHQLCICFEDCKSKGRGN